MAGRKVVICEPRLAQYRVRLFELMRAQLAREGVTLHLLLGRETADERARGDSGYLDWAVEVPTRFFLGERLCWQPLGRYVDGADLVVVNQHNKLLYNHLMMVAPRAFKLAFWDHGRNLQSANPGGLKERFKGWTTTRVDWWFAYTDMTADIVAGRGFPRARITVLNNAIDTSELDGFARAIRPEEVAALRAALGLEGKRVGIYLGSLYSDKRLDFLVEAANAVRGRLDDFALLVVGDGLDRAQMRAWAQAHPWLRWVGAQRGRDKALHARLAEIMLIPAQVGLVIVDSFVLALPLVTTDYPNHSPEFAYLAPGVNGLITPARVDAYADAIVGALGDPERLRALRAGCRASAREYTIENMADRFTAGILRALAA